MEPQQSQSTTGAAPSAVPPLGSAFDLVKPAVNAVKNNWQAFVVVNLLTVLAAVASIFVNDNSELSSGGFSIDQSSEFSGSFPGVPDTALASVIGVSVVILLVAFVVGVILQAMATKLHLQAARGEQPSVSSLFEAGKKYALRLIGLGIVAGFIIVFGLVLLIVPGLIAIGRLSLAAYHMVDKDLGIMDALRASNEQAKQVGIGKIWGPIGVVVVFALASEVVGIIPVLGTLVAIGFTIVSSMILPLRYQQLKVHGGSPASTDPATTNSPPQTPPAAW